MGLSAPATGVVPFDAADQTWKLRFSVNAMVLLERAVEGWTDDAQAELNKLLDPSRGDPQMRTVRAAVWAALQEHHPDLTQDDVGHLIDYVGLVRAGSLLQQAITLAFPPASPSPASREKRAA